MTRINCVPVEQMHTKQLHGEYVELPRVFVHVQKRIRDGNPPTDIPQAYTMGKGHVTFFFDKLWYLYERYTAICVELEKRGVKLRPRNLTKEFVEIPSKWWGQWEPSDADQTINWARINDRLKSMQERGIA